MKNLARTFIVTLFLLMLVPDNAFAQRKPKWAPARGYQTKTRYIYFPEENMYYDLNSGRYMYLSGKSWTVKTSTPRAYIGINLGNSVQIELDFNGDKPYQQNAIHIIKYKKHKKPKKVKVLEVFDDQHECHKHECHDKRHHHDHHNHHDHHDHKHGRGHDKHRH